MSMTKAELLMPAYRFGSLGEVTPDILREMGAKAVGLDIDNVIAPDGTLKYAPGVKEWVKSITDAGIPVTLISNGTIFRVKTVSKYLGGIPFVHLAKKPRPGGLIKAAKRMNVKITELAMLGDQLFSDIKAANRCGAIAVRIDPLPGKSLYPHYYEWKAKREKPYLDAFEERRRQADNK